MKNVKKYQLQKCILLPSNSFKKIIHKIYGESVDVKFTREGMWIGYTNDASKIPFEDISRKLAEYFDVKSIISIHMNDGDIIGVWICYKED